MERWNGILVCLWLANPDASMSSYVKYNSSRIKINLYTFLVGNNAELKIHYDQSGEKRREEKDGT